VEATSIDGTVTDQRTFVWGAKYTPSRYYKFLFEQVPSDEALNAIWSSKALPKPKVFLWLLIRDRLNTKDIMLRKNWKVDSGPECVLCSIANTETRNRLFFECDFTINCWNAVNIQWTMNLPFSDMFRLARDTFQGPCFLEVVACVS
jgi:uncharacterized HAD superfamily protein